MTALGRHLINLDLFTESYRVSGRTHVATSGLLSELNNPNSDFLELEEAYISRMHEPGKIVGSYAEVSFRKRSINFVVLQDRRDGTVLGTTHGRSLFGRGRPIQVFLTTPSFEISGSVMHDGQTSPGTILVHTLGHFQPIFDAEACAALFPHVTYRGDLILVQKDCVGIFCLAQHKE
ncbi:MAG TPA: hypothetical protein VE553_10780 [Candidatus Binatia bacterium]|jgi:hypothetical protein|nr:hypothetical protein [Candidatus Binatia bacterium]